MMEVINILNLNLLIVLDFFRKEHPTWDNAIHIEKAIKWLCRAHDSTDDGGVSEGYHLFYGWLPSYPETTGYIIETFFDYFTLSNDESMKDRAIKMADWLLGIQNNDGSIPDSYFKENLVFDTGQVIFGFVRTYEETKKIEYKSAAVKAGEWLTKVQEEDGSWQKHALGKLPHTYYTRVAWSLLRLHNITKEKRFLDASIKNIYWALSHQEENGWFNKSSFTLKNHSHPYTHTIAYTIRGILEAGLYLQENKFIKSVTHAMDNLIKSIPQNGGVFGSYDNEWTGNKRFSCLTGNAQLAIILFKLFMITKNDRYITAGKKINHYLKCKQELRVKNVNLHGSIAGSYPIWGRYIHFTYPNWAAKFFIDSLLLENKLT